MNFESYTYKFEKKKNEKLNILFQCFCINDDAKFNN